MLLKNLLLKPNNKILSFIFLANLLIFVVFEILIFPILLASFPLGYGLNEFKFAWTKQRMEEILYVWISSSIELIDIMILVHVIDFFFMANYGILLSSGIILVARGLKGSEKPQNFYLIAFFIPWIAVILDVIEGINIFIILLNPSNISEINTFSAAFSTTICVYLLLLCIILIIIGIVMVILLHTQNKKR